MTKIPRVIENVTSDIEKIRQENIGLRNKLNLAKACINTSYHYLEICLSKNKAPEQYMLNDIRKMRRNIYYKVHDLKIWPEYYVEVKAGFKTFEVRKNDRDFKKDEIVILHEYDPHIMEYTTSEKLIFKIGYVLPIENDYVVFSLLSLDDENGYWR